MFNTNLLSLYMLYRVYLRQSKGLIATWIYRNIIYYSSLLFIKPQAQVSFLHQNNIYA